MTKTGVTPLELLAHIERLSFKATRAPWFAVASGPYDGDSLSYGDSTPHGEFAVSAVDGEAGWCTDNGCGGYGITQENALLIAALRNNVGELLGLSRVGLQAEQKLADVGVALSALDSLLVTWRGKRWTNAAVVARVTEFEAAMRKVHAALLGHGVGTQPMQGEQRPLFDFDTTDLEKP